MGRIIGIDYGTKRVGIAVTDPLQIIATALDTVNAQHVLDFLAQYCTQEVTDAFVVGMPLKLNNSDTNATSHVKGFVKRLKKKFPGKPVYLQDERFTSKEALSAMIQAGTTKKYRRDKRNIDKVSATIILQSHLEKNNL